VLRHRKSRHRKSHRKSPKIRSRKVTENPEPIDAISVIYLLAMKKPDSQSCDYVFAVIDAYPGEDGCLSTPRISLEPRREELPVLTSNGFTGVVMELYDGTTQAQAEELKRLLNLYAKGLAIY
jgi:hypothetical protein